MNNLISFFYFFFAFFFIIIIIIDSLLHGKIFYFLLVPAVEDIGFLRLDFFFLLFYPSIDLKWIKSVQFFFEDFLKFLRFSHSIFPISWLNEPISIKLTNVQFKLYWINLIVR